MIEHTLYELKEYLEIRPKASDEGIILNSLTSDSRMVTKDAVFMPLRTASGDGHLYIEDALKRGAAAIIVTDPKVKTLWDNASPKIKEKLLYPNTYINHGGIASWFYGEPSRKLRLLGVTGTNGKSTVTHMIAYMLQALDRRCAVFGTLGYGFLGDLKKCPNTTMPCTQLQCALDEYYNLGASWAALEVSSIGVCEERVEGCIFKGGGFTNLTRDHLDYHKTEEDYFDAKKRFMDMVPARALCINDLDPRARILNTSYPGAVAYGVSPKIPAIIDQRYVWIDKIEYGRDGMMLNVVSSFGKCRCRLNLLGHFNAENFACALAMLLAQNLPFADLIRAAESIRPVPGRMECFSAQGKPRLIVDYAHTPDGVESALKAVRAHTKEGRIIIVLGCGGDRDPGKRSIMAMKACVFADQVVITSDNPRTESLDRIISDMLLGVPSNSKKVTVEKDRKKAILSAWHTAGEHDVILIAGKGHEDYQIFKEKTVHFSDREIAAALIEGKEDGAL